MDFETFIEGPLLWIVFSIFIAGLLFRLIAFLISIFKSKKAGTKPLDWKFILSAVGRIFFPLHKALIRKPLYTTVRYIFHICLFLVPLALDGHVTLWEASSLEISWPSLPDKLADWITIIFIVLSVLFLLRRILFPNIRRRSSAFDTIFIIMCLLPFLSGYFYAHGTLDSLPFFLDNLFTIHIISSCIMILGAVFLFLRSRLDAKNCTGCAACELNCPTGTLEYTDKGIERVAAAAHDDAKRYSSQQKPSPENQISTNNSMERIFSYSHYRCISCGECIVTCPEDAAELRHEMGFVSFFRVLKKQVIRAVDLKVCQKCGALFAPEPQIENLGETIKEDYIHSCPKCKKIDYADTFRRMLPFTKKTA